MKNIKIISIFIILFSLLKTEILLADRLLVGLDVTGNAYNREDVKDDSLQRIKQCKPDQILTEKTGNFETDECGGSEPDEGFSAKGKPNVSLEINLGKPSTGWGLMFLLKPSNQNKTKLIIGLIIVVAALGYFSFLAFQSGTVYYYTVGEIKERGPTLDDKLVRVSGKLEPESFLREELSTLARFSLTDGPNTLPASYDGVLPGLFFNEHSDIILEGHYRSDGSFSSENVIVKCPSKYIAEN